MKNTMKNNKEAMVRARDEWDARNAEQKAKHEAQYAEFNRSLHEIFENIKKQVLAELNGIKLNLEVLVDAGFRLQDNSVQVTVKSDDDRTLTPDKALRWSWKVNLENSAVNKESSSWSGLQATTLEQVESLRQSVNALEILNKLDWESILTVTLPKYSECVTEKSTIGDRPKFELDIRTAEIAELIGTSTLVKGRNLKGSAPRSTAWYLLIGESSKQFKVAEIPAYSIEESRLAERGLTLAQAVEQAKN